MLNLIDPQTGFLKSMLTSKDSTNEDQVVNSNNNNNNSDDQDNPNNNNNSDVQEVSRKMTIVIHDAVDYKIICSF